MSRLFDRSASDYMTSPTATWSSAKLTVGAWVNLTSLPQANEAYTIAAVSGTSSPTLINWLIRITANASGLHRMQFLFTTGIFTQIYQAPLTLSADEWHHYLFYADAATNPDTMEMWFDGASQTVTDVTGFTDNMPGSTNTPTGRIGRWNGSTTEYMDGSIGHLFTSFDQWAQTDIEALAKGYSPRMFPAYAVHDAPFADLSEQYYLPLIGRNSPETSPIDVRTAAVTSGTAHSPHPRMMGWA